MNVISMTDILISAAFIALTLHAWRSRKSAISLGEELKATREQNSLLQTQISEAIETLTDLRSQNVTLQRQLTESADEQTRLESRNAALQDQLAQAVEKLAVAESTPVKNGGGLFQKSIEGLVALGVPGLVLLVAVATSGFAGAAALTSALAALGGPFGMIGGVGVLLLLVPVSKALARHGLPRMAQAVVHGLVEKGESRESIRQKIRAIPKWVISEELRTSILNTLEEASLSATV